MRIRRMDDGRPEARSGASLDAPLYFIQPRPENEELEGPAILARHLVTGLLGLTHPTRSHVKRPNAEENDRKLSFWTDASGGARIYSPYEIQNRENLPRPKPFEANPFGHVNRVTGITELIDYWDRRLMLWVQARDTDTPDSVSVKVLSFTAEQPLLIVHAGTLFEAFPHLQQGPRSQFEAKRMNEIPTLDLGFPELADLLQKTAAGRMDHAHLLKTPVARSHA